MDIGILSFRSNHEDNELNYLSFCGFYINITIKNFLLRIFILFDLEPIVLNTNIATLHQDSSHERSMKSHDFLPHVILHFAMENFCKFSRTTFLRTTVDIQRLRPLSTSPTRIRLLNFVCRVRREVVRSGARQNRSPFESVSSPVYPFLIHASFTCRRERSEDRLVSLLNNGTSKEQVSAREHQRRIWRRGIERVYGLGAAESGRTCRIYGLKRPGTGNFSWKATDSMCLLTGRGFLVDSLSNV